MPSVRDTIIPKSDQLNAEDLLLGPITVTVQEVKHVRGEQPLSLVIDGGHQPYKPCKTCRRILAALWGEDSDDWVGKRMTLYCDPSVKWAGESVGGIRISHMSHIEGDAELKLTVTRGKRESFRVEKLPDAESVPAWMVKAKKAIAEGRETPESIIEKLSAKRELTEAEVSAIYAAANPEE